MLPFNHSFFGTPLIPPGLRLLPGVVPTVPYSLAQQTQMFQAQAQVIAAARAQQQAASTTPQPMLVPTGMGDAAAAGMGGDTSASPRADSPWTAHRAEDGRTFYHNKITNKSTWIKPDELKTPAERLVTGKWKLAMSEQGKPYYYNTETKETTWTMPEGFNDAGGTPSTAAATISPPNPQRIPMPGSSMETVTVKEEVKTEMDDIDKAIQATLAANLDPILPPEAPKPRTDVPLMDEEQELKKRQANVFRELLRIKYDEGKISSTDSWDHAVKFIGSDPRFRVLQKVSEKKQVFNAWKVQRQKEERDEKRLAVKKAKEDLEKWLQEHPKMKTNIRYQKAMEVFDKEPIWKAVSDADRRDIFSDVQAFVHKREAEFAEKTRKRNIQALSDILDGMRDITYRTTWAQAQRLLIENPAFADDVTLQSMDKEDALIVFEDFIRNAEKVHDSQKEVEERRLKRQERKVREAFQQFLEELHQKGVLHSMSLWSSLYPTISPDPRFDAMLMQSGSTPLDLFKFYVEELKEQYSEHRRIIKDILTDQGKNVKIDTAYDQLVEWVQADERGKKVDAGNMKLCYNSLIEKAEQREKELEREEQRKKKRFEGELRNLLRSIQPPVDAQTEWASILPKIENESAFKAVDPELREKCFADFIQQLGESCGHHHGGKKKKKEKKKKADSGSESDEEKPKKRKRTRDGDDDDAERSEKKKKKKSRRHSRSRSRSGSDDDDRRKQRGSEHLFTKREADLAEQISDRITSTPQAFLMENPTFAFVDVDDR
ncbi:unnamed protein product, partial [Mesorhabditis belari]|uniref:Uncharacterized protein n=1 Tax=Mesorhabditis belari TaxID=2138241 RepID=A0AAF3FQD4_9BILA